MSDPKLWIQLAILAVTVAGAWFALRAQVDGLKESLAEIKKTLDDDLCVRLANLENSGVVATAARAEEIAEKARSENAALKDRVIAAEKDISHQVEGFARIEKLIGEYAGSMSLQIGGLSKRIDDALTQRAK